jgi:hypothetical protein
MNCKVAIDTGAPNIIFINFESMKNVSEQLIRRLYGLESGMYLKDGNVMMKELGLGCGLTLRKIRKASKKDLEGFKVLERIERMKDPGI